MRNLLRRPGFTLVELVVAMTVSTILIGVTVSVYTLFRKSINLDQNRADLTQNARVTLDRLSRDIRQTPSIVTLLPTDPNDTTVTEPGEIEFEDGHAQNLTYLRYYLNGETLELATKQYYFSYDTGTRVHWNSTGNGGIAPTSSVISTQDVADRVKSIAFYGRKPLQIIITTTDDGIQTYVLRTSIYERNT